jgi:dienelactone hydrolase
MRPIRLPVAAFVLGMATISTAAAAAERVDIANGAMALHGVLFKPEGSARFPAVVALHGCDGLLGRSGRIFSRFADWGSRLSAAGLAVLFPDSFAPRGLARQCRVPERRVRSSRERVTDANAARRWLQSQPFVLKDHVSLMGWSSGGIAALWAVRPRTRVRDSLPDFRSAVAFYPGCRRLTIAAWSARVPTLILTGRADDWTPAAACEQMVAGARGRSARASIVVYPGAYQEFDRPNYAVRVRSGLAHSANGSGRAHIGTNAAARADVLRRVPQWLKR